MARILVVEDDIDYLKTIARIFKGNYVVTKENEDEAILALDNSIFDLVCTDLKMKKDTGGFSVLKKAKEKCIRSVVYTGVSEFFEDKHINKMQELGAFSITEKGANKARSRLRNAVPPKISINIHLMDYINFAIIFLVLMYCIKIFSNLPEGSESEALVAIGISGVIGCILALSEVIMGLFRKIDNENETKLAPNEPYLLKA